MKKIPTIFKRNPDNMCEILPEPHPDCAWVFAGEGVATRKYDGTCCLIEGGKFYKRRELKDGTKSPQDFVLADYDAVTGKAVGWVLVDDGDKWHLAAWKDGLLDGTYELLGPKIQGNPEGYREHVLLKHSEAEQFVDVPRTFEELREWLVSRDIEGLVFHHPDGRMAKIKKRDYGLGRKYMSRGDMAVCRKCGGKMKPGQALGQTCIGFPDFIGGEVITLSPGGPGYLIDCLKCEKCGYSITYKKESY